jgi:endonuclease-8
MIAVGFNILVAEFHNGASLDRRDGFNSLGPSFLTSAFDESEMISRLRSRPDLEIGVGLLSQSLISGIGNVYKSEVCFACGVNPFRKIASLTDQNLECLVKQARNMMLYNVQDGSKDGIVTYLPMRRTTGRFNPSDRLWVYRRAGERCRRCGGTIMSRKQGIDARTSFWCPSCQPIEQQRASA